MNYEIYDVLYEPPKKILHCKSWKDGEDLCDLHVRTSVADAEAFYKSGGGQEWSDAARAFTYNNYRKRLIIVPEMDSDENVIPISYGVMKRYRKEIYGES